MWHTELRLRLPSTHAHTRERAKNYQRKKSIFSFVQMGTLNSLDVYHSVRPALSLSLVSEIKPNKCPTNEWRWRFSTGGSHLADSRLADRSFGRQFVFLERVKMQHWAKGRIIEIFECVGTLNGSNSRAGEKKQEKLHCRCFPSCDVRFTLP
ncbi:hypothetical protein M513_08863 [Trichuris suis]|uniref:Uncharacterized protein n=1 Tax=Trichuris suis TaxID=68888 RepID=A0A085LZ39_9BILA|nr:hypothetical protein M513_08863 [Trichuris suis]